MIISEVKIPAPPPEVDGPHENNRALKGAITSRVAIMHGGNSGPRSVTLAG